ncbi:MAG: hypothetical protein Q8P67_20190 [archaeon]|nr:hypothetical protein [archaeon]
MVEPMKGREFRPDSVRNFQGPAWDFSAGAIFGSVDGAFLEPLLSRRSQVMGWIYYLFAYFALEKGRR